MLSGLHYGSQGYCSYADNEGVAVLPEGVALPAALALVLDVSNWSVSDNCAHYGWPLYARWYWRCSRAAKVGRYLIEVACVMVRVSGLESEGGLGCASSFRVQSVGVDRLTCCLLAMATSLCT